MSVSNHRCPFRPVRGGTLLLQGATREAGTLGVVLTADGVDRWLLTCHHVLVGLNNSLTADPLYQPTLLDGNIAADDARRGNSELDCAAAKLLDASTPLGEVLGIGPLTAHRLPVPGMIVVKSGWRTGVTEGVVRHVSHENVIIQRLTHFPQNYLLGAEGDSGSVWVERESRAPVALHVAESATGEHVALATVFQDILDALGLMQR